MIHYSSLLKILVFVLILGFYASFLFVKIGLITSDNDAGLYISDGRLIWETKSVFKTNPYSFVETNFPVVNHHWASSVVFFLVSEFSGFGGLTVFKSLILFAAFSLLFWVATKKADFWLVACLSLPVILILKDRVRIRPEIFSYLFIAIFLYFLIDLEQHPEHRRIYWLIPLQIIWVNFHIFFFIGIALAGGFALEKIILNYKTFWRDPTVRKLILILVILIAACFINPNGLAGMLAPVQSHSYSTFAVQENQPLFNLKANFLAWNIFGSAFIPMVFIFFFSLVFAFRQKKKPIFYLLVCLGSAAAGLISIRLVTLFALMFLPSASSNFSSAYIGVKEYLKRKWPTARAIAGYTLAFVIAAAYPYQAYQLNASVTENGYKTNWGIGLDRFSSGAGNFFKEQKLQGPIFNDYDIGGYILYNLFPKEKVFVDNNGADSYSVSFFDDLYMPTLGQESKWQSTQEKYQLNAIFISIQDASPVVGSFLWNRLHDPAWALVYADTYSTIFLRNIPANQEIIDKFHITPENVEKKISYLLESDDVVDRIVGGRILYLIGREDLSTSALKKVVAQFPKNSWVWLYMGSIKVLKNDTPSLISAVIFLENAINMGEKTSEGYTWLGLAYFRTAQFAKAENAFQKALWINPGRYDASSYLNQLQNYLVQ